MSRATATALSLLLLLATALPVAADEPDGGPPPRAEKGVAANVAGEVVPGEVLVKWRDDETASVAARSRGLTVLSQLSPVGRGAPAVVATNGRGVNDVLGELRADPRVEYAEPSYRVTLAEDGVITGVPVNDPLSAGQYSLDQMRVRDAWSRSTGGNGVVAVLDTGVQANHPDLVGRVLPGYDFVNNDTNAADDNGHGTWVAGVIAANANDGYGTVGVSWSDKILPVKIMDRTGTGSTADLLAAITWATDHGATIINMSVGGFPYSQAIQDAINDAWNHGVVLVGAAGNNHVEETYYPASFDHVVSVSATQVNGEFAHWSSYGPKVDVSAPGASVQTTNCTVCTYENHNTWGSHTYISGTSFATPNVAGVIALIRAHYPSWAPSKVVSRLLNTVDDLGYPGTDIRYGRGRVNALRALGGSVAAPSLPRGDALEPNNTLGSAREIPIGSTTRPSIHPAGDLDVFAVDVPRAGRLDVRVTGVVDNRDYPWNRSTLPIDPIVELYDTAGTLLRRVDAVWENGTELASVSVGGPKRILVRIRNYYANGNTLAYGITPTYVDTVAPKVVGRTPGAGASGVATDGTRVTARFDEPVTGVSTSTMRLTDPNGKAVAATVTYSSSKRTATLISSKTLRAHTTYRVTLTSGVKDTAGHALASTSWSFTTGRSVNRVAGSDRYATAAALSKSTFDPGVPVVYIATGLGYPDALAGAPAASVGGGPLLLTAPTAIPSATAKELSRLAPGRIVILGGTGVVSAGVESALRAYTTGTVSRLSGSDRYATAAAISASVFAGGADTVYVATGTNYPDALAAGAAAAGAKVPILLVAPDKLPKATAGELARLAPTTIVVMGGTASVNNAVASALARYATTVTRVAGADRFATAVSLSQATTASGVSRVYVASGMSFPDGLAAGPVAGLRGAPLLLVDPARLPSVVTAELKRLNPASVVVVGGTGVVSDPVQSAIQSILP